MFTPTRKDKKYCRPQCCNYASAKRTGSHKVRSRRNRLSSRYKLSEEAWDAMQRAGCQICGKQENLVVDHDHTTGVVCGCLCSSCNKGLGFFLEDKTLLKSAQDYLERTKKAPKG